eukprot:2080647-Prymnesium_polylepis.1
MCKAPLEVWTRETLVRTATLRETWKFRSFRSQKTTKSGKLRSNLANCLRGALSRTPPGLCPGPPSRHHHAYPLPARRRRPGVSPGGVLRCGAASRDGVSVT